MSRVVFFGYGPLAVAGLRALADSGASIAAAVVPGNRSGEGVDLIRDDASARRVAVWVQPPRGAIAPFLERLRGAKPDVIVVWSYSMILPADVLAVPRRGAVNVHGGLLPEYRGGHVMQWAILNGEPEFGVTLHYMDEGIDTGPVIAEARFPVGRAEDAASLRARMGAEGVALLTRWWPRIADGTAPRRPQDERRARYWRMRTPDEGRLAWTMPAETICRTVRALACNVPGAFVQGGGRQISIRRAVPLAEAGSRAGVRVRAADAEVLITEVVDGGRAVAGAELAGLAPLLGGTYHEATRAGAHIS